MTIAAASEQQVQETPARPVVPPAVEIIESENDILLTAEMPGVDEQSADVSIDKNILTIRGAATISYPEGLEEVYREWVATNFERSFTISDEVGREDIEATVKNGVLTLRLPKAKEAKTQKIKIKAG